MIGGFFLVDRGIWKHPLFSTEVLTRREAWLWLIARARFSDGDGLNRGQLRASEHMLAQEWHWSRSKVQRFLRLLQEERMITRDQASDQASDQAGGIITICNYKKYQSAYTLTDQASDQASDHTIKKGKERKTTNGAGNGTMIDPAWEPDPFLYSEMETRHGDAISIATEVERFRNHYLQTTRNARRRNWSAAFRNWCLKAIEFQSERAGRPNGAQGSRGLAAVARELFDPEG